MSPVKCPYSVGSRDSEEGDTLTGQTGLSPTLESGAPHISIPTSLLAVRIVLWQLYAVVVVMGRGAMPLLKSSKSLTYRGDKTRERYTVRFKIFF